MQNHREKTISGFTWSAIGQVGTEASKFLVGIILARMLGPEAFGLIGMVLVFTGIANIVLEFGFAEALIQRKEVSNADWSTVFWVNIIAGSILALLLAAASPVISLFYDEPALLPITLVLSFTFLLQALAIIQKTQFTKQLEFKKLAKVDIAGFVGSGILALTSAFLGLGVWSLVIQHVSRSLIMTIMLWVQSSWRPTREFDLQSLKSYASFSIYMFFNRFLGNISMNIDSLLIGKVLGKEVLGLYNRAFFFMIFPVNSFTNVVTKVLFPSMSSIQEDQARVSGVFQKMVGLISLCIFPVMTGLLVFASPFVYVLFGEIWAPMIPYLRVFSVIGMAATLSRLTATAVLSMGNKRLLMKMTLLEKPLVIFATGIGIIWGIWGILIGKVIITVIILIYKVRWAAESLKIKPMELVYPLVDPLLMSAIMGLILWGFEWFWTETIGTPGILFLIIGILLGGFIYFLAGIIFKPASLKILLSVIESRGIRIPAILRF